MLFSQHKINIMTSDQVVGGLIKHYIDEYLSEEDILFRVLPTDSSVKKVSNKTHSITLQEREAKVKSIGRKVYMGTEDCVEVYLAKGYEINYSLTYEGKNAKRIQDKLSSLFYQVGKIPEEYLSNNVSLLFRNSTIIDRSGVSLNDSTATAKKEHLITVLVTIYHLVETGSTLKSFCKPTITVKKG